MNRFRRLIGLIILLLIITTFFACIYYRNVMENEMQEKCSKEAVVEESHVEKVEEPNPIEMTEELLAEEEYCDQLELLAICVQAEAGNQDLTGRRLVADVILNRVDSEIFPDTIEGVISQNNQFSTYTDGAMENVYEPDELTFKAVQMEVYGERLDKNILYFTAGEYNKYCKPLYKHDDHYFGY